MSESDRIRQVLESKRILDRLASIEHERWAHWQRYVHAHCQRRDDGSLVIPPDLVARWAVGVKIGVFGSEGDAFMAETIGRTSTGARTITIVAARAISILVSGIVPIIAFSGVLAFTIAQGETDEA